MNSIPKFLALFSILGLIALFSSNAWACAVCFVGKEGTMWAYYGTAIALSLLPIGMVGGLAYWFYRQYKQADSEISSEQA